MITSKENWMLLEEFSSNDWMVYSIEMKETCTFTSFDIVKFYPSISEDLWQWAIRFTKDQIEISGEEVGIIQHYGKSLLFSKDQAWVKKEGSGLFDVAMVPRHVSWYEFLRLASFQNDVIEAT